MAAVDTVDAALGDLEAELADTRRVLERLPDDQWGWRPHEKSMTLGELGSHCANLLLWGEMTLEGDHFDTASVPGPTPPAPNTAELLALFDGLATKVRECARRATAESLAVDWTLRHGDKVLFSMPRATVMRRFVISHLVHHRGQLSVYLRQLGVALPAIYGPSADEGGM